MKRLSATLTIAVCMLLFTASTIKADPPIPCGYYVCAPGPPDPPVDYCFFLGSPWGFCIASS